VIIQKDIEWLSDFSQSEATMNPNMVIGGRRALREREAGSNDFTGKVFGKLANANKKTMIRATFRESKFFANLGFLFGRFFDGPEFIKS